MDYFRLSGAVLRLRVVSEHKIQHEQEALKRHHDRSNMAADGNVAVLPASMWNTPQRGVRQGTDPAVPSGHLAAGATRYAGLPAADDAG